MQSTLVDVNAVAGGGKGTNPKTTLYVGGLEENVNEAILHSAFIPFGDIKDVNIPLDHATGAPACSPLIYRPLTSIDLCTKLEITKQENTEALALSNTRRKMTLPML